VWQHFNDVSFIDEFLTPDFIAEHMFFGYEWNDDIEAYTIATRDFKKIKEKLLFGLTNHGRPFIYVVDGNYENRGELYLQHRHEGMDLKEDEARDTLRNIFQIWTRPVHLETMEDGETKVLSTTAKTTNEYSLAKEGSHYVESFFNRNQVGAGGAKRSGHESPAADAGRSAGWRRKSQRHCGR
jgi:stage V sporulation protein R